MIRYWYVQVFIVDLNLIFCMRLMFFGLNQNVRGEWCNCEDYRIFYINCLYYKLKVFMVIVILCRMRFFMVIVSIFLYNFLGIILENYVGLWFVMYYMISI